MSEVSRRSFTGTASPAAGSVASGVATGADFPFKNNVPDPLLSGKELPTFKFELEKSQGKVIQGSWGKEATVTQLPISKGIAGVSMTIEPGAIRELHWHATAAEWAFVLEGRVRTTVIAPDGSSETDDFEPGDVWYFPRGHAHMIQCLGDQPCHFILIFDNGYFSEFGTFSLTDWIGRAPPELLAKNFGMPESAFEGIPDHEVYFVYGPIPPDEQPAPLRGKPLPPVNSHKYRLLAQEPHSQYQGGREWRVGAEQFPISETVTGVLLELEPGGLRELHWHPTSDEWQYLIDGQIDVSMFGSHGRYRTETLNQGDVGYIPQGYGHSIENTGTKLARILLGFNTGHYTAIDLSTWLASNSSQVLASHFNKPQAWAEKLPHEQVFIAPK